MAHPHGVDPRVIEKARKLDARDASSGWSWGRLALEAVPHYQRGRHDDGALAYFADESGWTDSDRDIDTLRRHRAAAADWSAAEVKRWPGLTIDSACRLGRREDRDEILAACRDAHSRGRITARAVRERLAGPLTVVPDPIIGDVPDETTTNRRRSSPRPILTLSGLRRPSKVVEHATEEDDDDEPSDPLVEIKPEDMQAAIEVFRKLRGHAYVVRRNALEFERYVNFHDAEVTDLMGRLDDTQPIGTHLQAILFLLDDVGDHLHDLIKHLGLEDDDDEDN